MLQIPKYNLKPEPLWKVKPFGTCCRGHSITSIIFYTLHCENAPCSIAKKLIYTKNAQFQLLISLFFTLKMRISKSFTFLFPKPTRGVLGRREPLGSDIFVPCQFTYCMCMYYLERPF